MNSLAERDGLVTEAWQPSWLPATCLVDPQRNIRYQGLRATPLGTGRSLKLLRRLSRQTEPNRVRSGPL